MNQHRAKLTMMGPSNSVQTQESLATQLRALFLKLYPAHDSQKLITRTLDLLGIQWNPSGLVPTESLRKWDQSDAYLITYGDSVTAAGEPGLKTFTRIFREELAPWFSAVHILPFHPYTSDDGFAVSDFNVIRPDLGDWADIRALAQHARVMGDLVINHISSQHAWFKQFVQGQSPGARYIKTVPVDQDLSIVVRPRSHELAQTFETKQGDQQVWCTFSRDQVDVDFAESDLFFEFLEILLHYVQQGIRIIRLDAVGFVWKEPGTPCLSLPQAHWIVQLIRTALTVAEPEVQIITETNVPLAENLSYFGEQNEAHMIYNFSLAPILAHAILSGDARAIRKCLTRLPSTPAGCAYFNFTASHDGIGLRPAEMLLDDQQINKLIEHSSKMGGEVTYRQTKDQGLKAYELNITLASLLSENFEGDTRLGLERFILSQAVAMSIEGIPAIYIQSVFASLNDREGFEATGIARRINRKQWTAEEARWAIHQDPRSSSAFRQITSLLEIRRGQPAFHPNATQYTLNLGPHILGIWRESLLKDQSIFCIFNLSAWPQPLDLNQLNLLMTQQWIDLISSQEITNTEATIELQPCQILWISNKDARSTPKSKLLELYEAHMPL